MARTYAFIDGAAFEYGVAHLLRDLGASFEDINWDALTRNADRIFYFDALPTRKNGEDSIAFEQRLEAKQTNLARLRRVPNMHVREGFTRIRENTKRPAISQKGVDIALAVEVLLHAHLGNIENARLFLNDLDFFPLLESLTNTRVRTELFYSREKTAKELLEVADISEEISHYSLLCCLPQRLRDSLSIEGKSHVDFDDAVPLRKGHTKFGEVTLYFSKVGGKYFVEGCVEGGPYECSCCSDKILISYFEIVGLGHIIWDSPKNDVAMEPRK